jgi:hypothetical protein
VESCRRCCFFFADKILAGAGCGLRVQVKGHVCLVKNFVRLAV